MRMLLAHRAGVNVPGFPGYRMDENAPELSRLMDGSVDKNEPIRVVRRPGAEREYRRHRACSPRRSASRA